MLTFRKLAAGSAGALLLAYFTEQAPPPRIDASIDPTRQTDTGGRLTAYYTGRDGRAAWRPDMPEPIARALGVDRLTMPKDADLMRLFEARCADTGEAWSDQKRKISALDLTFAPHKSVTLAAEFAATSAESAMIRHATDRAADAAMRFIARDLGWARKGRGGEDGADPGAVAWVSFRHHTARPTVPAQDGLAGATYLAQSPTVGDPHDHIHHALFNVVATDDGRVGSLDTKQLTRTRLHTYDAFFQAKLAEQLRDMGIRTSYHPTGKAVVIDAIPEDAVALFSKGREQVLGSAKAYAASQGLDWHTLSADGKFKILAQSGLASRLKKHGDKNDHEVWREQAAELGWHHTTVLEGAEAPGLTDAERFDKAYHFAARHLAQEFHTAAVIDHDKLAMYATMGLIGTGISGGIDDIGKVVALLETRGIAFRGEHVTLVAGLSGDRMRVTNTAQALIEERLAAEARRAAADRGGALPPAAIKLAIDCSGLDFATEPEHGAAQRAAIYALGGGGKLTLLTGVAGSGKTTLLRPLVVAWQADQRFAVTGREVIGLATGWRQADALHEAGIRRAIAIDPLLKSIASGSFQADRNTVLVIDEISQVAPRALLQLLELQRRTGLTIKALGDREQAQSIEAGDAMAILRRVMPKEQVIELLTTVRQVGRDAAETWRLRTIAGLFRGLEADPDAALVCASGPRAPPAHDDLGARAGAQRAADAARGRHLEEVRAALRLKREDGTARFIGGDHQQVLDRVADFYMERRDALTAAGSMRGITVSALTNADAADISRSIRDRIKTRGELGSDERVYQAVDQRGSSTTSRSRPATNCGCFGAPGPTLMARAARSATTATSCRWSAAMEMVSSSAMTRAASARWSGAGWRMRPPAGCSWALATP